MTTAAFGNRRFLNVVLGNKNGVAILPVGNGGADQTPFSHWRPRDAGGKVREMCRWKTAVRKVTGMLEGPTPPFPTGVQGTPVGNKV